MISNEARDRAFGRLKTEPSTFSAQERPSKPIKRLLNFDESDESIEEEDELDAELSRLLIDKLKLQFIIVCRYRKESALDEDKDPLHWWGAMKATISKIFGAGKETPLGSSHQEGVQLDRLLVHLKKAHLVRGEYVHAAFPQGQHRALIL